MKNTNSDKSDFFPGKPKRKRKSPKAIENIGPSDLSLDRLPDSPITPTSVAPVPENAGMSQTLANILQNTINKYSEAAEKQTKDSREDFDTLQPIISEFLDDFILIGHTIDGQRVVMRYTSTPADLDKLTELCKKVLIRMMIQEQNGN